MTDQPDRAPQDHDRRAATSTGDEAGDDRGAQATIDALTSRVAELEDQLRRTLADLDNLRKRVAREYEQQRAAERARVAAAWLPVVDNLERALEHADSEPDSIVKGIEAVREQALDVLARLGFPRTADLGEPFDPARHEAVAAVPHSGAAPGTVIQVVRPGYGSAEHQLRPAAVVVATGVNDG